ncbi:MAG: glycosyltransferase family 2 protein [Acidimicrobiales bacterium]
MKLSVVTTLYRSAPHLEEFHRRMTAAASARTDSYEIIYVNDGSPDHSLDLALDLAGRDPHVRVVDLARNYEHLKAMMTGLELSAGEFVFLVDCDLEEEPELLLEFWDTLEQRNADVVYGVQEDRKGNRFERLSGWAFYTTLKWFASTEIPRNMVTARLMSRDYVRNLVAHREREIYLGGLFAITGFRQVAKRIVKHNTSESTYSTRAKARDAVNAITAFSNKPLIMIFWLGMLITVASAPILAWLLIKSLFFAQEVRGWTSLMVSLWFLGGLIVFVMGIIAIYLSKIFVETKQRPYTIIRGTHGWEEGRQPIIRSEEQIL